VRLDQAKFDFSEISDIRNAAIVLGAPICSQLHANRLDFLNWNKPDRNGIARRTLVAPLQQSERVIVSQVGEGLIPRVLKTITLAVS
jgi:hypothetical protein